MANNMLLYRAIKPIRKGEQMLAWYSTKVQQELCDIVAPSNDDYKNFNELLMSTENGNIKKKILFFF